MSQQQPAVVFPSGVPPGGVSVTAVSNTTPGGTTTTTSNVPVPGSTTTIDTSRSLFGPLSGDPRAAQATPAFRYPSGPVLDLRPPQAPTFGAAPGDTAYAQAVQLQQQQQYQAQLEQQQAGAAQQQVVVDAQLQAYYEAERQRQVARRRLLIAFFIIFVALVLVGIGVAFSSSSGGAAPLPPIPPVPEPVFQPFHRIIVALQPTDFDIGGAKNICSFTIRIMQVSIQRTSDSEWISLAPPNTLNWFHAIDLVKVARERAAIVIADAQGVASAGFSRVRIHFAHLRTNDCNTVYTPGQPPVYEMDFPFSFFTPVTLSPNESIGVLTLSMSLGRSLFPISHRNCAPIVSLESPRRVFAPVIDAHYVTNASVNINKTFGTITVTGGSASNNVVNIGMDAHGIMDVGDGIPMQTSQVFVIDCLVYVNIQPVPFPPDWSVCDSTSQSCSSSSDSGSCRNDGRSDTSETERGESSGKSSRTVRSSSSREVTTDSLSCASRTVCVCCDSCLTARSLSSSSSTSPMAMAKSCTCSCTCPSSWRASSSSVGGNSNSSNRSQAPSSSATALLAHSVSSARSVSDQSVSGQSVSSSSSESTSPIRRHPQHPQHIAYQQQRQQRIMMQRAGAGGGGSGPFVHREPLTGGSASSSKSGAPSVSSASYETSVSLS